MPILAQASLPTMDARGNKRRRAAPGGAWHAPTEEVLDRHATLEASYQALVEQIPAILYIDHPQDNYHSVYVSPQLETILEISPARWIAEDLWVKHLHPDDRERVLREYEEFLRGGPDIADYRMIRPDGKVVWIRDRGKLIRDEHGNVVLEQGVMFDVTEQKEAEELLRKADAIGRAFTELALRGASPERMLERLAAIAENPVALEDAAHQLVAFAVHGAPVEDVLRTWEGHSRVAHEEQGMGVTRAPNAEPRCAFIPIRFRDEPWGRMHLLEIGRPIGEVDVLALDRAGAAVGLALLAERDAANLADHAGSALVFDILHNRYGSPEEVLRRARGLGADMDGRRLTALVLELPDLPQLVDERGFSERNRQRIRATMLRVMREAIAQYGCSGLAATEGDRVLAIVALPKGERARELPDGIGREALRRIEAEILGLRAVVGASDEASIDSLGRALEEAGEAATYAARVGSGPSVHWFRDLGVECLLIRLADGPELARFVESTLRTLLDHDATSNSPLLPTLHAYLDHGGKKVSTARALRVERRSLYYRLAHIEQLIGQRLDDRETLVRLEVALRGLDLLRARAPLPSAFQGNSSS